MIKRLAGQAMEVSQSSLTYKPASVSDYKRRREFRERGGLPGYSIAKRTGVRLITLSEFNFPDMLTRIKCRAQRGPRGGGRVFLVTRQRGQPSLARGPCVCQWLAVPIDNRQAHFFMTVRVAGFEPATFCSQSKHTTKLCYTLLILI